MVNFYQRHFHAGMTILILLAASAVEMPPSMSSSSVALLQQAAVADGYQPFVSHFSLTCPLIKPSVRRNLTTTIVFDELVVKGEQAHKRRCLRHHMLCCDVDIVKLK